MCLRRRSEALSRLEVDRRSLGRGEADRVHGIIIAVIIGIIDMGRRLADTKKGVEADQGLKGSRGLNKWE